MELLNHDLAHEFPQYLEKMQGLKASDAHFSTLVERYDACNHTITQSNRARKPSVMKRLRC